MTPQTRTDPSATSGAGASPATDARTEFDEPGLVGASSTASIAIERFDAAYSARPPWDIDGPQPEFARLVEVGLINGQVLDVGCGTGENALHFASRGLEVTGVDGSPLAIARAQTKARERGLSARFVEADALHLEALGETFDTVTDSGLLHVFSDEDMAQAIRSIHAVLRPSGHYWLMCFSEHATFPGPRRITRERIGALFSNGWEVRSIEPVHFETLREHGYDTDDRGAAAWLADIERL